ncbi:MAG TPA: tryptophan 2,3-dioxygenase family protein [Polyangiaceae bacterium LLY-WYZ-15_(1-7)]|nr:tryptophan 2,3-dioxygenase family protein [Polyangiaceae bacterium LLY-WYZ-15_(1-7)]HJL00668.1 tryptophan 2,3-dioxygenase family protein [Polyangiaceae bacterium LLY-WYZ-15_(1-7)]HJL08980.1 tryptophan 2,3-dioxygenase family protein [Polyangiaceae bacterium LLY-WYZ-15_(1-7)]HJL28565.1 tryptophan 2,3-dioxygenase family protein [Polyangiaceae bacterium LLY-WYZ-15_(1-7)]HJL39516.1 tryptophan 2,3-dioxygenase family protein [Polyangiaceae bacterium LLY-WYZ-15_(1-7)]
MKSGRRPRPSLARALAESLAEPIPNKTLKRAIGDGDSDYERYLRTAELLALQTPKDQLVHRDEHLFQIVHQSQELWLSLVAHEAVGVVEAIEEGELVAALDRAARMARVFDVLERDIRVLDTLSPAAFMVIRKSLGQGSGLESPGYNALQLAAPVVAQALEEALGPLVEVYRKDAPTVAYRLCEQLVDVDAGYQRWLMAHFLLVRRTLGVHRTVSALDGFPTTALPKRMVRALFPELWDVRVKLTQGWSAEGGFEPGADRSAESS